MELDNDDNTCPACGREYKYIRSHLARSPNCQNYILSCTNLSTHMEPIGLQGGNVETKVEIEGDSFLNDNSVNSNDDDVDRNSTSKKARLTLVFPEGLSIAGYESDNSEDVPVDDLTHDTSTSEDVDVFFRQSINPCVIEGDLSNFHMNPFDAFPSHLIAMIRLITLLRQTKAPKKLLDDIIDVLKDEILSGRTTLNNISRVDTFLKGIHTLFVNQYAKSGQINMLGTTKEFKNGIYPKSPVFPVFPFANSLQSLLNDSAIFSNLDNLVILDSSNRWSSPLNSFSGYGHMPFSMQEGAWQSSFNESFLSDNWLQKNTTYFRLDYCLYTDKTGVDAYSRHGLEPVVFSLTLLNEFVRNKSTSWRHILFMPTFYKESASKL